MWPFLSTTLFQQPSHGLASPQLSFKSGVKCNHVFTSLRGIPQHGLGNQLFLLARYLFVSKHLAASAAVLTGTGNRPPRLTDTDGVALGHSLTCSLLYKALILSAKKFVLQPCFIYWLYFGVLKVSLFKLCLYALCLKDLRK